MLFKKSTRDIVTGKRPGASKAVTEEAVPIVYAPVGETAQLSPELLPGTDPARTRKSRRHLDPESRKYLLILVGIALASILSLTVFMLLLHAKDKAPAGPTGPQIGEDQTVITVQADEALAALAAPGDIVQVFAADGSAVDALRYLQVYRTAQNGQLLLLVDSRQAAAIVGRDLSTRVVLVAHGDSDRAEDLLAMQKRLLDPEISLTLQSTQIMTVGGVAELPLQTGIEPAEATLPQIQWTSDHPDIVSVKDGLLSARAAGQATVTVSCGGCTAACVVTVEPPLEELRLDMDAATLAVGETLRLNAAPIPETVTQFDLVWTVDDPTVATVSDDGTVTAISRGMSIVTVTCGEISATCIIEVGYRTELIDIKVPILSLPAGQQYQLDPYFYPSQDLIDIPEYSSSDTSVATVDEDGTITAIAQGTAIITLRRGNVTTGCQVTVR